jgi:antitoxin component of RelBE/YafQ-DinJ toxin-antitoxin module
MADQRIELRVTPALRKRAEKLAEDRNTTLSGAIKSAVLEATKDDRGVPTEQEILELLGEAARTGNVSAMKELRAYHREQQDPNEAEDPLAEFDELAERRAA